METTKTYKENTQPLHPSGLTWHRWHWPFKTDGERRMVQEWIQRKSGNEFDDSIPF